MVRKTDPDLLRNKSIDEINESVTQFEDFESIISSSKFYRLRWVYEMSIVELHALWEKFAENALIIAYIIFRNILFRKIQ